MPLYEYRCDACGKHFEVIQKFSEVSETCRLCGKGPVQRQASAPGIQFKGSGWYITDYAQKGKSGEAPSSAKTSTDGDSKKSDSASAGSGESSSKGESSTPAAPATKS